MMDNLEAQQAISEHRGRVVVITTMTTSFEWPQVSQEPDLDLLFSGAMGKASSVGLGLALARPDLKVLVLDGDGSLLMNLGSLVTIAHMAPPNLIHFVFENRVYRTSGGQPLPLPPGFSFAALARAAGYPAAHEFDEIDAFRAALPGIMARRGPALVVLKVPPAAERPPYPFADLTPEALARLKATLGALSPT